MEMRIYYRVIVPDQANRGAATFEAAQQIIKDIGKVGTPDYRNYWKGVASRCTIQKIIELSEEIPIKKHK